MATATDVQAAVQETAAVAQEILTIISVSDPALSPATGTTMAVVALVAQLAAKALAAWTAASSMPITVQGVQALAPNPTPLPPPTA